VSDHDIKADNILLRRNTKGQLYPLLTDFEYSCMMCHTGKCTFQGGTQVYLAPELVPTCPKKLENPTTYKCESCDVFSLGVTMFILMM